MDERIFFEIELHCPACDHDFILTKTKTKVKENMPIGFERYLVPIYKNEEQNPMSYEIDVCPKCYFSAFHKDFIGEDNEKKSKIYNAFSEETKKIAKRLDFNVVYRTYEMARLSYIFALTVYENENPVDYIKIGKCYIRTAWYSKAIKDYDFYKKSLNKALETYLDAYNEIEEKELSATLMYLISVIYIELGDYEASAPFISKLNADMYAKKLPTIKDGLEEITNDLRIRLKEIEEVSKNLNDDEKKKARENRKNAVKVKEFKKPFGIELKKVEISNLKKREYTLNKAENTQKKIVIGDESRLSMKNLEYTLKNVLDIVGFAVNEDELINLCKKEKPDYVIFDIDIPGKKGIKLIEEISYIDKNIKVIVLSGHKESTMVIEAIKAGAVAYLLKPLNREKLLEIVKKA